MPAQFLRRWINRGAATPPLAVPAAPSRQPGAESVPPAVDDVVIGRLLDAVGTLVQLNGAFAYDTDARSAEDARQTAERWKRHLTLGLPHPERDVERSDPDAARPTGGIAERDWEGASRHALADRRAEHAYVVRTTGELREAIWMLVQGLHRVAVAESAAGETSSAALRDLRASVSAGDPGAVRDVVLAALGELAEHLAQRERERERQLASLGDQIASLGAALDEARREGATDPLTQLGNRRAFDAAAEHAVALRGLWRQQVCLILLDVDGLKAVNDTLGHAAGDEALQGMAAHLSRVFLRRSDVLARVGGDEFAVLLRDTSADDAARIAARVIASAAPGAAGDDEGAPRIGLSAGIAVLQGGEDVATWCERADAALYAAKRAGGGRVEVATPHESA